MPRATAANRDLDVDRLCSAVRNARKALERFRQNRREAVKQYAGANWSEDAAQKRVPVNLLAMYATIVGRSLIAKEPRVMLSTFDRSKKPAVAAMEKWANERVKAMGLAVTLQRIVLDALFSVGVCKVALSTPADAALGGWDDPAGTPFAERVDLDDFVFDVHARDMTEAGFVGHRYRVPLDVVRNSKLYGKDRGKLEASDHARYNADGDERIGVMGRGWKAGDVEEFEDYVDLWECYIPRKKIVVTLRDDGGGPAGIGAAGDPLLVQDWVGPPCGPYHVLGYGVVPGNAMPKGPIMDLIDLHLAVNRNYRKLIEQSDRQKEVLGVQGGATEDGGRVMQASDGDIIRVDNPDSMKPMSFGGPNQMNAAMTQHFRDTFSWAAGNLDMLGGLSPQSKTATQDKMLSEAAAGSVQDMQATTLAYTAAVGGALCWYWWHDPFKTVRTTHQIEGAPDLTFQRHVGPADRAALRYEELEFEVDPYSLTHSSPQQRMAALNQVVMQVMIPLMPVLQQQGVSFDMGAYLAKMAKYMDMPDLGEIVTIQEPPQQDTEGGPGEPAAPGQAPETTRNYVRRSEGADTSANRQAEIVNMARSGGMSGGRPDAAG